MIEYFDKLVQAQTASLKAKHGIDPAEGFDARVAEFYHIPSWIVEARRKRMETMAQDQRASAIVQAARVALKYEEEFCENDFLSKHLRMLARTIRLEIEAINVPR